MGQLRFQSVRLVAWLTVGIAMVFLGVQPAWSQTKSKSKPATSRSKSSAKKSGASKPGTAKTRSSKKRSAKKPPAPKPVIVFENRTYSQLRYKLDGASKWKTLLPGARRVWTRKKSRSVEIKAAGIKPKRIRLTANNTYFWDRADVTKKPRLVRDKDDLGRGLWTLPLVPQASEFDYGATGTAASKPLERFVDSCRTLEHEYRFSLKEFAKECEEAELVAGKLPVHLRYCKGFTWFFGYIVDKSKDDVVLLGIKDPTRPPINADCLATAIKAAHMDMTPRCSLDSHKNPKYQKSVITGVSWQSRWAEIMIDADYKMKLVCQGKLATGIRGLVSWFDLRWYRMVTTRNPTNIEDRWWFNFDNTRDRAVFLSGPQFVVLYRNPVLVSTEKKVGGMYLTGATDPDAVTFATLFTIYMEPLGRKFKSIGELLALYRVYDLMVHLHHAKVTAPGLSYWVLQYKPPYAGPPAVKKTSIRFKRGTYGSTIYTSRVRGGVNMQIQVDPGKAVLPDDDARVQSLKDKILSAASP